MCQEVRSLITPHKFNIDSKKWPYLKAGHLSAHHFGALNSLAFGDVSNPNERDWLVNTHVSDPGSLLPSVDMPVTGN